MLKKGKLYVFEGADGAGKTAISNLFLGALKNNGIRARLFGFPGNTPNTLGNLVYQIHHTPEKYGIETPTPSSLQAMHIAAHLNKIERNLIPLLESGETVVLDRFWWSTWVYGIVSGVPEDLVDKLVGVELIAWKSWLPACVFNVTRHSSLGQGEVDGSEKIKLLYSKLAIRENGKYPIKTIENDSALNMSVEKTLGCIS